MLFILRNHSEDYVLHHGLYSSFDPFIFPLYLVIAGGRSLRRDTSVIPGPLEFDHLICSGHISLGKSFTYYLGPFSNRKKAAHVLHLQQPLCC